LILRSLGVKWRSVIYQNYWPNRKPFARLGDKSVRMPAFVYQK